MPLAAAPSWVMSDCGKIELTVAMRPVYDACLTLLMMRGISWVAIASPMPSAPELTAFAAAASPVGSDVGSQVTCVTSVMPASFSAWISSSEANWAEGCPAASMTENFLDPAAISAAMLPEGLPNMIGFCGGRSVPPGNSPVNDRFRSGRRAVALPYPNVVWLSGHTHWHQLRRPSCTA